MDRPFHSIIWETEADISQMARRELPDRRQNGPNSGCGQAPKRFDGDETAGFGRQAVISPKFGLWSVAWHA